MKVGFTSRRSGLIGVALAPVVLLMMGTFGCREDKCDTIDNIPPAPPIGVYSVTGDEEVSIYWWQNTERDLSGYNIYWKDVAAGPYRFLADTDQNFFIDTGLQNGVTYYYIVTAFDRAGNESLASEEIFDTPRPEGFGLTIYNVEKRNLGGNFLNNSYDFSAQRRLDAPATEDEDITFSYDGQIYLMYVPDFQTDIQDAGYIPLEDVNWAPDKGWSPTGTVELIPGHSYIVWTRTNNFAKFQVSEELGDLNENFVVIDWAYQDAKGNPELVPPRRASSLTGDGGGR
jgi:hypothetical protein